jgi:hypothetical protein
MAIISALPAVPFNPTRLRSYILRLPLFTRAVLLIILAFWLLELQTVWNVVNWGSLIPDEMGIASSTFCPQERIRERETIAETAGIENYSVPIEYLPRHTHGLLPYPVQHVGADAASGAV